MPKIGDRRIVARLACAAALALLAACTASGPGTQDNPLMRKLTWFSYIKGDDIRANCVDGAPDRYRFVYNGVYVEQVRTYDIEPAPMPGHMRLTARVSEKANVSRILIDPSGPDLFLPWRPTAAVIDVPNAQAERLKHTLFADGFLTKAPPSRSVSSIEFYWAVSACIGGRFHLNAFVWPHEDFKTAAFPSALFAWDMTGVVVNQPRPTDKFEVYGIPDHSDHAFVNFFQLRFDRS